MALSQGFRLQVLGKLPYQIWQAGGLSCLLGGQMIRQLDAVVAALGCSDMKGGIAAFGAQHHSPTELMSLFSPVDITRYAVVA